MGLIYCMPPLQLCLGICLACLLMGSPQNDPDFDLGNQTMTLT